MSDGRMQSTLDQKWAAYELLERHQTGELRVVGAVLHECDAEGFEKLMALYPEELQAALQEGLDRKAFIERLLGQALIELVAHPALFVELGEEAERLLERAARSTRG